MPSHNKKDISGIDPESILSIDDREELFSIFNEVMRLLRSPKGCKWDREQDHRSLQRNLIEEAYETVEAIEAGDDGSLKEELGDLLLQVVFHSQIASEEDSFDIKDVLKSIICKLVRRHPHVFGEKTVNSSEEVLANWEDIKKQERKSKGGDGRDSIFKNIPKILPALHYAYEVQSRAKRLGFDWDTKEEVFKKIEEESDELKLAMTEDDLSIVSEELGDMLFSIVNLSRHFDIDAEAALRDTSKKFIERFDLMEEIAKEKGIDFRSLSLEEKDKLWEEAKGKIDEKD